MFDKQDARIWPVTLPHIETTIAAYLGPGRVQGNKQGECFSRQISMYLAKHVGGWSTPQIGRFYNGRQHHNTTVLYAIEKIERLRKQEPSVDALLEVLSGDLRPAAGCDSPSRAWAWSNNFIDAIVDRILHRLISGQVLPREISKLAEDLGSNFAKGRTVTPPLQQNDHTR
jgi:chromosomal replication initiation ATPase DnaA